MTMRLKPGGGFLHRSPFFFPSHSYFFFRPRGAETHLYTQTAGLPLLVHGALSAGPTEHVGAHFALALLLLKERRRVVGTLVRSGALQVSHTWRRCNLIDRPA